MIGGYEVMITVSGKGNYQAWFYSSRETLNISQDGYGINSITKEKGNDNGYFDKLEVYA